jgi:hypothetical protein
MPGSAHPLSIWYAGTRYAEANLFLSGRSRAAVFSIERPGTGSRLLAGPPLAHGDARVAMARLPGFGIGRRPGAPEASRSGLACTGRSSPPIAGQGCGRGQGAPRRAGVRTA